MWTVLCGLVGLALLGCRRGSLTSAVSEPTLNRTAAGARTAAAVPWVEFAQPAPFSILAPDALGEIYLVVVYHHLASDNDSWHRLGLRLSAPTGFGNIVIGPPLPPTGFNLQVPEGSYTMEGSLIDADGRDVGSLVCARPVVLCADQPRPP